jgi:hypothetical protein
MGCQSHAVLILDNYAPHTGPEVDETCTAHGVVVFPLPPHSSNQLQRLDLSTFWITKRDIARIDRMATVNV